MASIEQLLEAERRGILPEDKKPFLDEARRRGLVPAPAADALPEQNTVSIPNFPDIPTPLGDIPGEVVFNAPMARTLLGAGRNLATGLARLPFDLANFAGAETDFGERLSRFVPQVETETTNLPLIGEVDLERAGQDILPFFAGGLGGARAALSALPKAAGATSRSIAGLTGAAAGDAAVVDPSINAGTAGDLFSFLPTAIEPDDSPAEIRAKQAIDAAIVGTAAAPFVRFGRNVGRSARDLGASFTEGGRQRIVGEGLREEIEGARGQVEDVVGRLDETLERTRGTGFEPTTGQASADPGLIGIERSAAGQAPIRQRRIGEQDVAIQQQAEAVTGPGTTAAQQQRQAAGRQAQEALGRQAAAQEAEAAGQVQRAEQATQGAQAGREGLQEAVGDVRGQGLAEEASAGLSETLEGELRRGGAAKKQKFREIDPEGTVPAEEAGLRGATAEVEESAGRLAGREGVPQDIIDDVNALEEGTLTFKELQDLRPRVSDAIGAAQRAGQGRLVENLTKIKSEIAKEADRLAKAGGEAGERAQEAVRFFKEDFAPKFRTGEGEKFAKAVRTGTNIPTKAGAKFLKSDQQGGRESAQQLKRILDDAPDPGKNAERVRDFFVGRFMDASGGNVTKAMITRFIQRHSQALKVFPEVRNDFFQLRNRFGKAETAVNETDEALKAAVENQKNVSQKVKDMAATRFFTERDPLTAVNDILKSKDPGTAMRKLVREARADPSGQARKGIKAALNEWVQQGTTKVTKDNFGTVLKSELDSVEKLFSDPRTREALEAVYSKAELDQLRKVRELLRIQNRTAGGGTGDISAVQDAARLADRARIFAAAVFGIVKGRAVFTLSKLGLRATGQDPVGATSRLLRDAMMDPELARAMLMRTDSPIAKRKLNAYITNNILAETDDETPEKTQ